MEGDPILHLHAIAATTDGHVIHVHLFRATVFSNTEIAFVALRYGEVGCRVGQLWRYS
jgi:predicted DNA-binding protein with PD1-like motif